jgi:hypothetical protein
MKKSTHSNNNKEYEVIFHGGDILKWLIALPKLEAEFAAKGCLKYIEGREAGTSDREIRHMAPNFEKIAINLYNKKVEHDCSQPIHITKFKELIDEHKWIAYFLRSPTTQLPVVLTPDSAEEFQVPGNDDYNFMVSCLPFLDFENDYPFREMEIDIANHHLSKFELNHIIPEKLVAILLKNARLTEININRAIKDDAIEEAIKNKNDTQTDAEAAEKWEDWIQSRQDFIKNTTHYQSTDIATEYDKQKTVYIKNLEMVKDLKSSCNIILNNCLGVAPLDVINTHVKAEEYIEAWQRLKDYHTQSGSYNSTEIINAVQNAIFKDDERVEQWVEKMKSMFKNIASVQYLQTMMELYPNDKTRWRLDDQCMEFNSWDKTDLEIRNGGYRVYLMHATRLNYLMTSLNKNPSNKFKVVIDKFTLEENRTVKGIYNLLIKWNADRENYEYSIKNSSLNNLTVKNSDENTKNNQNNKKRKKEVKICKNHPNSTSHTTSECTMNEKHSKTVENAESKEKKKIKNNKKNSNDENTTKQSRHCSNCAINNPSLQYTHDLPYCRKPGGPKFHQPSNKNPASNLSPDITNAINSTLNAAFKVHSDDVKIMLQKAAKGEDF